MLTFPGESREVTCATNAVELWSGATFQSINMCKLFPIIETTCNVVCLELVAMYASKQIDFVNRNWKAAMNCFMIEFEYRVVEYV